MRWQLKLLKNSLMGILPISIQEQLRLIKRKIYPHRIDLDKRTLDQGIQQVQMLIEAGFAPFGKDYLELGTGWSPIIPIVFYLAGCRTLTLVDGQRLMDDHTFGQTCQQLIAYSKEIANQLNTEEQLIEDKLIKLTGLPLAAALKQMNAQYLAPCDLFDANLGQNTIDIISSRAVLEHISPTTIKKLFIEFNKLLRSDGAMCHIIDNSDHWEHGDKSIGRLNFLKYSQASFNIISSMNPLDYQNRLRHSEYKTLMKDTGFKVIFDQSPPDQKALNDLNSLRIDKSFQKFTTEDLAILTSYVVAAKAPL